MATDNKRDEDITAVIEKYLATLVSEGYTPEQAKQKVLELIDRVRKATVKDRRNALRVVRDAPDKL